MATNLGRRYPWPFHNVLLRVRIQKLNAGIIMGQPEGNCLEMLRLSKYRFRSYPATGVLVSSYKFEPWIYIQISHLFSHLIHAWPLQIHFFLQHSAIFFIAEMFRMTCGVLVLYRVKHPEMYI